MQLSCLSKNIALFCAMSFLIVLDTEACYDAIRRRAAVRYVISRGKLLAETSPAKIIFYRV